MLTAIFVLAMLSVISDYHFLTNTDNSTINISKNPKVKYVTILPGVDAQLSVDLTVNDTLVM